MKYLSIHDEALEFYRDKAICNIEEWLRTHSLLEYNNSDLWLANYTHSQAIALYVPIHIVFFCHFNSSKYNVEDYSLLNELKAIEGNDYSQYDFYNEESKVEWSTQEIEFLKKNFVINDSYMKHRRLFDAIAYMNT